ncbi:MFS multidrug transporter-like protein [Clohesyomyces aquaticus]|uniref:MFS multidrug transporter-like protein n=1 Tax=Clohesyomyces aquaticus TaxID=1231657 RepID=A0A1Y1YI90_9PLEO|nr:MFS multidrug transporter-like protein [Clohesyomyces aquaticus]
MGLLVAVFVVQMESSIISTAVLDITNHLGGYEMSSWLFTAYLVTYCGLQMVWAKISDIVGRKPAVLASLFIFTLFSGLCGASHSLTQLIHFRWAQGIGGCGVFALVQLLFFELVPPQKWPAYISLVTGFIALSVIAGPLLGGAITLHGSWRWIFLLNAPVGALTILSLYAVFPRRLWNEPAANIAGRTSQQTLSLQSLRRVDACGSLLLLGSCVLSATGLQQAATGDQWNSPAVLGLLVCTAPLIALFFIWQWYVTTRQSIIEPVFPWRFCQSRIRVGMIINTYLVGTILSVCVVQIPQRFSTVYGLSPFVAATKLLSFGVFVPAGSSLAAGLMGKLRIPPCWVVLGGAILQITGLVLLSEMSDWRTINSSQYGFQILAGTGVGFVNAALTLLVPYAMEKRDLATGTSAVSQFRVLGGLIGISIVTSVSTPYVRGRLLSILSPQTALQVLERTESLGMLDEETKQRARKVFMEGFTVQLRVLIGFAVAQIPATLLMWTNKIAEPGAMKK